MEIHTPTGPIRSLKHLLVELSTITLGVLIALSLEGVTASVHQRMVVREARANMASEMHDNQVELDHALASAATERQQLTAALHFADQLLAHHPIEGSLSLDLVLANLSAASKSTADLTGALGFMDYREVKKYAAVYELQAEFTRFQDRILEVWIPLYNVAQGDIEKKSDEELRVWQQQLLTALSYLQARDSIGKSLRAKYTSALGAP